MEVDQSALTGESLPVEVKPGGAVYSGSILRQGEADARVYATGTNTYFGKTAELVQSEDTVSHFQRSVPLFTGAPMKAASMCTVTWITARPQFRSTWSC
jgi:cation transport ATPase